MTRECAAGERSVVDGCANTTTNPELPSGEYNRCDPNNQGARAATSSLFWTGSYTFHSPMPYPPRAARRALQSSRASGDPVPPGIPIRACDLI